MSIVVGLKHNNHVYIASDSQITVGEYKKPIRSVKSNKIWHPSGLPNIVFGTVGLVENEMFCRLQTSSSITKHTAKQRHLIFTILLMPSQNKQSF